MKYITLIEDEFEQTIYCLDDELYSELVKMSDLLGGFQCIYDLIYDNEDSDLCKKCKELLDKIRECDILKSDRIVVY